MSLISKFLSSDGVLKTLMMPVLLIKLVKGLVVVWFFKI